MRSIVHSGTRLQNYDKDFENLINEFRPGNMSTQRMLQYEIVKTVIILHNIKDRTEDRHYHERFENL